jgi:protein O-mannosyl-transferase
MNVSRAKLLGLGLAIFAGTLWLHWPSVKGEFLRWDDTEYLRQSIRWNGLTWGAVKWAFTTTQPYYHPLPRLSHVLDYQIWGSNAAGHHATSVVVHALNAALVFGFLWTLLGAVSLSTGERLIMAVWVAAVFAVHPLQVESVAWMSGRTQLLCTTFGIGSLWAYAAGARRWMVWGLYVAALLCKPMAVSFPFVMLAMDYYPLRRYEQLGWARLLLEKAVLIALAGVVSLLTMFFESRKGGLIASLAVVPLSLRVLLMFNSLAFYPLKLFWPAHLSPNNPISWGLSLDQWPVLGSALGIIVITIVAIMERRRLPMLTAAWGAYVMLILPVSGLVQTGAQAVAQRYAYVAMLPLLLLAGGAMVWLWRRSTMVAHVALLGLLAGPLCVFAVHTRSLIPIWGSDEALLRVVVNEQPHSEEANRSFAMMLLDHGKPGEALGYAQRDVSIAPRMWQAHMTLGLALGQLGRLPEAIGEYQEALRINPDFAEMHFNCGVALMETGQMPEAMEHYKQALQLKPDYPEAHMNLATALLTEGKVQDAIAHYEEALRIKPDYIQAHDNLGIALAQAGRVPEAMQQWQQSLKLKPDDINARMNLGNILEKQGRVPEAMEQYEQVLKFQPGFSAASNALVRLRAAQTGR